MDEVLGHLANLNCEPESAAHVSSKTFLRGWKGTIIPADMKRFMNVRLMPDSEARDHFLGTTTSAGRKSSGVGGAARQVTLLGDRAALASMWVMVEDSGKFAFDDGSQTSGTGCPLYHTTMSAYFGAVKTRELRAGIAPKKAMPIYVSDLIQGEKALVQFALDRDRELLSALNLAEYELTSNELARSEGWEEALKAKMRTALATYSNKLLVAMHGRHLVNGQRVFILRGEEMVDVSWITLRGTPLNLVAAPAIVKNRQDGPPPWEEASLYHSCHGRYCHSGCLSNMPDLERDGPISFFIWATQTSQKYLQLSDAMCGVCMACAHLDANLHYNLAYNLFQHLNTYELSWTELLTTSRPQTGRFAPKVALPHRRKLTMHAYMHAYIHTCMHAYMHAYMHTYIHTYIHTCPKGGAPTPPQAHLAAAGRSGHSVMEQRAHEVAVGVCEPVPAHVHDDGVARAPAANPFRLLDHVRAY